MDRTRIWDKQELKFLPLDNEDVYIGADGDIYQIEVVCFSGDICVVSREDVSDRYEIRLVGDDLEKPVKIDYEHYESEIAKLLISPENAEEDAKKAFKILGEIEFNPHDFVERLRDHLENRALRFNVKNVPMK